MQIIDLFSGIGGFSLAGRWMGWRTVQFCEIDKYCKLLLKQNFSGVPIHQDIKTLRGSNIELNPDEPSILVGGFPCFTKGTMVKTLNGYIPISELSVGDMVLTHTGAYMPIEYLMEKDNADILCIKPQGLHRFIETTNEHPFLVKKNKSSKEDWVNACDVKKGNFIGYRLSEGYLDSYTPEFWYLVGRYLGENVAGIVSWDGGLVFEEVQSDLEAEGYEVQAFILPAVSVGAPHQRDRVWFVAKNTNCKPNGGMQASRNKWQYWNLGATSKVWNGNVTNCNCIGCNNWSYNWKKRYIQRNKWFAPKNKPEWKRWVSRFREISTTKNSNVQRCAQFNFSPFNAKQGHNDKFNNAKLPNWDKFPTQSPVCGRNDGISNRVDRIKALGNAIVPQVAFQIFKAIQEYENYETN